jgi:hypothetical protein
MTHPRTEPGAGIGFRPARHAATPRPGVPDGSQGRAGRGLTTDVVVGDRLALAYWRTREPGTDPSSTPGAVTSTPGGVRRPRR